MLLKDIISNIESKKLTIKELAEKYDKSTRTIQTKIKNLGYKWNAKTAKYDFMGEGSEPLEVEFDSLFDSTDNSATKVNKNSSTSSNASINKSKVEIDVIDELLSNDELPKRIYKGYYFDEDIINIIENVKRGRKSDLLNEVLRKVFKEKGLL